MIHSFCVSLGDGGNDVSMIQAGDVGIGLVGKVHVIILLIMLPSCGNTIYILYTVVNIHIP